MQKVPLNWEARSDKKSSSILEYFAKPKKEGGLELIDSIVMNKALVASQLWDIALKKDSLWVKWCNEFYFKQVDIWHYQVKQNSSWIIKKILNLRPLLKGCIRIAPDMISWVIPGNPFSTASVYQHLCGHYRNWDWYDIT
eukprot:TRINITY_DN15947_c0_g1_i1.p1 TRINITY_DN15947_c0_g1~~TRINITY_DN15947_c0_g1_i1.p1  ORF type:complete len:140 (+),score=10.38 TRINITY_DN15947_c0_g1_i1:1673-2092(+)